MAMQLGSNKNGRLILVMYPSEHEGNLEVKWIRGRLQPGDVRWAS